MYDDQVSPSEMQVKAAAVEETKQHRALVGIEIQTLNYFINKPFANGFCVLEYSKLKMYVTFLL